MSRAYIVYLFMFAILAGGMWVILTLGAAQRAPDDLTGDWQVAWAGPPPPGSDAPALHIDQSGRFFEVRLGKAKSISLTLLPGWKGRFDGPALSMQLDGQPWKMNVTGKNPPTAWAKIPSIEIELVGPASRHAGVARRLGIEAPATRAASPAASPRVAHAR